MRRLFDLFYAPLAALMLVLLIPFVCVAVIIGPTLAIRRETGRFCVRLLMRCIGAPMRVRGVENLPAGSAIVVCNHASYVDGIVLTAELPRRYSFVVQDRAARWPLVGQCLTRLRSEERRVGQECLRECRSRWSPTPQKQQHTESTH